MKKSPIRITPFLSINEKHNNYHKLVCLKVKIPCLYDLISIKKSKKDKYSCKFEIDSHYISNNNNLILKARDEIVKLNGEKIHFAIELRKNIPIGAGLAGGSSNAATVLKILKEELSLNKYSKDINKISNKLGKDIHFFLTEYKIAKDTETDGIEEINGEFIHSYVLIATPDIKIHSKEAYKLFDKYDKKEKKASIEYIIDTIKRNDTEKFSTLLFNDFEDVVLKKYNKVRELKEIIDNVQNSCLSGSGSSIISFFNYDLKNKRKALNLVNYLKGKIPYIKLIKKKKWKTIY